MDDRSFTGLRLGERYQVRDVLARGGLSIVYVGDDETLSRAVAIKAVPPQHAAAVREALRATAALTHPSVLMTVDTLGHEGWLFLVQELVKHGAPLSSQLRTGLSVERALDLGRQLGRVLAYAHAHQVVHGDVTPAAVLVDRAGMMHLNNFALPPDRAYFARAAETEAMLARSLGIGYTPIEEEPLPATPDEDVRAVGLLLWQTLAATHAAGNATDVRADVPAAVRELLARLIVRTHPERMTVADELVAALEDHIRAMDLALPEESQPTPAALRAARAQAAAESEAAPWSTAETQIIGAARGAGPARIPASSLVDADALGGLGLFTDVTDAPTTTLTPPGGSMPLSGSTPRPPSTSTPVRSPIPSGPLRRAVPSGPLSAPIPSAPLRAPTPSGRPHTPSGPLRSAAPSRNLMGPPSQPALYHTPAPIPWSDDPQVARWAAEGKRRSRGLGARQVVLLGIVLFIAFFLIGYFIPLVVPIH